jgi:hypothetical protein
MAVKFSLGCIVSALAIATLGTLAGPAFAQSAEFRRGYDQGYRDGAESARSPAEYAPRRGQIAISSASYGVRDAQCDAGASIQALAMGRRQVDIKVDNELCGDPAQGQGNKQLNVTYSCGNGPERRAGGPEGAIVSISCR